jgi:hypothetical protein
MRLYPHRTEELAGTSGRLLLRPACLACIGWPGAVELDTVHRAGDVQSFANDWAFWRFAPENVTMPAEGSSE